LDGCQHHANNTSATSTVSTLLKIELKFTAKTVDLSIISGGRISTIKQISTAKEAKPEAQNDNSGGSGDGGDALRSIARMCFKI